MGDTSLTVYLDVILIENIIMNYIILFATGIITKVQIKQINIIISSAIGAIYVVISYITAMEIYSNFILKFILAICMVFIAFKSKNIKSLFKHLIIFYLTSFAFGGCAFALLYYIRPQDILMKNGIYIGTYPLKIAFLGGIVGFTIVNVSFKLVKGKISKKDMFCEVEINFNNKTSRVKALIDSGNLLKDPITGNGVIVVESDVLEDIIPIEILQNINNMLSAKDEDKNAIGQEYISRLRLIPFSSLGKQNGMLVGFKPDNVVVNFEEMKKKIDNIIVGIYDKNLSKTGEYKGLVGINVIE